MLRVLKLFMVNNNVLQLYNSCFSGWYYYYSKQLLGTPILAVTTGTTGTAGTSGNGDGGDVKFGADIYTPPLFYYLLLPFFGPLFLPLSHLFPISLPTFSSPLTTSVAIAVPFLLIVGFVVAFLFWKRKHKKQYVEISL